MKALILLLSLSSSSLAHADGGCDNYCVGVRGNGEAEPAHPAALARMVEDFGMPKALAGGSSATVTMFFVEQVKANEKAASERDAERQRKIQALMLKSMPAFEGAMAHDAKVADAFGLMKAMAGGDLKMKEEAIAALEKAGDFSKEELKAVVQKYGDLLNPELVKLVQKDPVRFGPEAVKSVKNLGKFNAVTDDTIFFRPGLVDFKGVAQVLGYMGDFYAGNVDADTKRRFDAFLDDCADAAYHKEWADVSEKCRNEFNSVAADYLRAGKFANKALFEKVGAHGTSIPTTAVLQGTGMTKYMEMKKAYLNGTVSNIADFSVNFDADPRVVEAMKNGTNPKEDPMHPLKRPEIAFGYWGSDEVLGNIERANAAAAANGDAKALRFRKLGTANWFEVLSTSPAEPGIANAQRIPTGTNARQIGIEMQKPLEQRWSPKNIHYRNDVLSVGGWSDLHPTAVLKAQPGCDRVVYLTRHNTVGDSKFGQQIFIRLTGTKKEIPFWDKLQENTTGAGWCDEQIRKYGGDPEVVRKTPWARISNLCNSKSSFRRALDLSDAVMCTDWDSDDYAVFSGKEAGLVKNSYESPMFPLTSNGAACSVNYTMKKQPDPREVPGCLPYEKRDTSSKAAKDEGGATSAQ